MWWQYILSGILGLLWGFVFITNWILLVGKARNKGKYENSSFVYLQGILYTIGSLYFLPHGTIEQKLWVFFIAFIIEIGSGPMLILTPVTFILEKFNKEIP